MIAALRRCLSAACCADGTVGLTTLALDAMLLQDMEVTARSVEEGRHIPIPYGFMTGMRDQLL